MIKESIFIKSLTCFRYEHFIIPRIIMNGNFDIPYRSIIHYYNESPEVRYPAQSEIKRLVRGGTGFLYTQPKLLSLVGTNARTGYMPNSLINGIKKEVGYLKPSLDLGKSVNSDNQYGICNYGIIGLLMKYKQAPLTPWHKWNNDQITIWETINRLANETDSPQIIPIDLPDAIPVYDEWTKCSKQKQIPLTRLKTIWADNRLLNLLDLWRFFGDKRELSNLNAIDPKNYGKIYILFNLYNGGGVYYNLETLLNYIKVDDEKVAEIYKDQENISLEQFNNEIDKLIALEAGMQFDAVVLQKRLIKLFIKLVNYNNELAFEDIEENQSTDAVNKIAKNNLIIKKETPNTDASNNQDNSESADKETNDVLKAINARKQSKLDARKREIKERQNEDLQLSRKLVDDGFLDALVNQSFNFDNNFIPTMGIIAPGTSIGVPESTDDEENDTLRALEEKVNGDEVLDDDIEVADDEEVTTSEDLVLKKEDKVHTSTIQIDINRPEIETNIIRESLNLMNKGILTGNEAKRKIELSRRYESIIVGDTGKTLKELAEIDLDALKSTPIHKSNDILTVPDKSMLEDTINVFDSEYIKTYLDKHIAACCLSLQNSNIIVTDYEVTKVSDAGGGYQHIRLMVEPVLGKPTPINIKVFDIDEDGSYEVGGTKYRFRKQRAGVPIRKIDSSTVMLSTYYGEMTINRGGVLKLDYAAKLANAIRKASFKDDMDVTYIAENVFDEGGSYPRDYSGLSNYYNQVTINDIHLLFNQKEVLELFKDLIVVPGRTLVGYKGDKENPIYMDKHGVLFTTEESLGTIQSLLGLRLKDIPRDQASVRVQDKLIPMVLVLSYYYGFRKLLEVLDIPYQVTDKVVKDPNLQGVITFKDMSIMYDLSHENAIILNGFQTFTKNLRLFTMGDFENKDMYNRIFSEFGFATKHIKEMITVHDRYIDPISKDRLALMGEPTEFKALLIRSAQMLNTDVYQNTYSFDAQIIRGYERIPGVIYKVLSESVKRYNNSVPTKRSKIVVDNYEVWNRLTTDPSAMQVEEINPVHNIKEKSAITYTGFGGRSKDTLNAQSRAYNDRDRGIISEANKDSGDVGIESVLTARPNITNLLGFTIPIDEGKSDAAALCSTTMLLSPYSDLDDAKRKSFISIQTSSTIFCEGAMINPIRTGEETTIALNVDKMFAFTAKGDGTVISVTKEGIKVRYDDVKLGEDFAILGVRYGKAKGVTYPFNIVTDRDEGYRFIQGECLAYNREYFDRDILNKRQVCLKLSTTARVALAEIPETFEDSSLVSPELGKKFTSKSTDIKDVFINFTDEVRNIRSVGDKVVYGDILCNILNQTVSSADAYSQGSLDLMDDISADSPTSKRNGEITNIEIFYNGDKENLSESLLKLVNRFDNYCNRQHKLTNGKHYRSGRVTNEFKASGTRLENNYLVIRFYITGNVPFGSGDKTVVAHQLKNTASKIMNGPILTSETHDNIEMVFSNLAIDDRKVNSPKPIGILTTLCRITAQRAVEAYKK